MLIEKAQGELIPPLEAFDDAREDWEPLADGVLFDIPAAIIPVGCALREWSDWNLAADLKTYVTRAATAEKALARFFRGMSETLDGASDVYFRSNPTLFCYGPDVRIIVRMVVYRD